MIIGPVADLDEARLSELCEQRASESLTLEFKRELPGRDDRAKIELLKDVCGMANSSGGDIVYGIAEDAGVASRLSPITDEPYDAAQRRLRQVLDRIEPRLDSLHFQQVPLAAGGYAVVLRVPESYSGPHRFVFDPHSRFVMRDGTRTYDMSYDQLRGAFDRTASLTDSARRFRSVRLDAIKAGKTWRPMQDGPLGVLHFIPIAAMSGRRGVDVAEVHKDYSHLMLPDWGGASRSLNLDGLIVHSNRADTALEDYSLLFRSGALEFVSHSGSTMGEKIIPSTLLSAFFRDALAAARGAATRLGIVGPAIVGGALLNAAHYKFAMRQDLMRWTGMPTADRADLVLPEAWVDDVSALPEIDTIARPMLDVFWQAFGMVRCYDYDEAGLWNPRL